MFDILCQKYGKQYWGTSAIIEAKSVWFEEEL